MKLNHKIAFIGGKLDHSLLPKVYDKLSVYLLNPIDIVSIPTEILSREMLVDLSSNGFDACCITLPHKLIAYDLCDEVTPRAKNARSVNIIKFDKNHLIGDNTDGVGFIKSSKYMYNTVFHGKKILLLGAGGASFGIFSCLMDEKPAYIKIYNRNLDKAKMLISCFSSFKNASILDKENITNSFDIIINCTSASIYKQSISLPSHLIDNNTICFEIAYLSNNVTLFQDWSMINGSKKYINGLSMLVMQAMYAIEYLFSYEINFLYIKNVTEEIINENIVIKKYF